MRVLICLTAFFICSLPMESFAKNYLTKEEALENIFPGATVSQVKVELSSDDKGKIKELTGKLFIKRKVTIYKAGSKGYAIIAKERSKTKRFTFLVAVDKNLAVKRIEILKYEESHGYEVENKGFRKQFEGKTVKDPIKLKRDITNISGATMSARAVTVGVKKSLAVFEIIKDRI